MAALKNHLRTTFRLTRTAAEGLVQKLLTMGYVCVSGKTKKMSYKLPAAA